ncbi:hypothetical protein Taro_054695 [Colocasia esculenta]|uniref:Ubiquitin-like protease family profile domain-containing protein n=1 Tax=Colocasia esculenta TaxID=4460 RepID=A0A843XRC9_COLES|nr:hypothetical protein [Colocasia esculenta]
MLGTLGEERLVDVTILDCFWYHMYLNGSPKVMEWIKEKDIFSKTYTFVPIVDGGHWNLLILCNLENSFNNNYSPCMILLDSLIISEPLKAEPTIRRFVKELYHTQGKMASSRSIASIPLLVPKKIRKFADLSMNDSPVISTPCEELEDEGDSTVKDHDVGMKRKGRGPTMCHDVHALEDGKKICVEWDDIGQPVGKGGKSLRTFLGTVARNADKCPINVQSWDKMPPNCIEDVWLFIQRKYDVPNEDLYRNWVMKDLSFKWKFHKYDPRRKYLKQDKKSVQIQPPSRYNINEDMWREAVKLGTSSAFRKEKTGTDPDRAEVFIITHTRKDGRPINEECAIAINVVSGTRNNKMTGKKVKLLDLENEQVAEGIVMSMDPAKIVMRRPIGTVYCEVSIHYANKPDASLFVKNDHRFRIKDAIVSHILWFRDYVLVDEAKRTLFSGTKTNDI